MRAFSTREDRSGDAFEFDGEGSLIIELSIAVKAQITTRGVSRTMAVPDKVALGLFFFWWHGSSVRALPSSIPRMPLLLHRVLTRAPDARCRGAPGHRNQM